MDNEFKDLLVGMIMDNEFNDLLVEEAHIRRRIDAVEANIEVCNIELVQLIDDLRELNLDLDEVITDRNLLEGE